MEQRGTLNTSRKLEQTVGLLTAMYASANSKEKVNFSNYMPYEFVKEKPKPKSQEELYELIIAGEYQ